MLVLISIVLSQPLPDIPLVELPTPPPRSCIVAPAGQEDTAAWRMKMYIENPNIKFCDKWDPDPYMRSLNESGMRQKMDHERYGDPIWYPCKKDNDRWGEVPWWPEQIPIAKKKWHRIICRNAK